MLEKFNLMKKLSENSLINFDRSPQFGKGMGTKTFVRTKTEVSLPTSSEKQRVLSRRKKNVKKNKKIVTEGDKEINLFKEAKAAS